MNKLFLCLSALTPSLAHANVGLGAEGFWPLLLNSWLLSATFLITLLLAFLKFFKSPLRRNLFIGLNVVPLLITTFYSYIMLRDGAEISNVWWLIIGMLLSHAFSIAIPYVQCKLLSRQNA